MRKESSSSFRRLFVFSPISPCSPHLPFSCGRIVTVSRLVSELYRNTITVTDDVIGDEETPRVRSSSFNSKLRKGSTCNILDDSMAVSCPGSPSLLSSLPVERQIRYFIDFCPSLDPSLHFNVVARLSRHVAGGVPEGDRDHDAAAAVSAVHGPSLLRLGAEQSLRQEHPQSGRRAAAGASRAPRLLPDGHAHALRGRLRLLPLPVQVDASARPSAARGAHRVSRGAHALPHGRADARLRVRRLSGGHRRRRRRAAGLRQGHRASQRPRGDLPQELRAQDAEGFPGAHSPADQCEISSPHT